VLEDPPVGTDGVMIDSDAIADLPDHDGRIDTRQRQRSRVAPRPAGGRRYHAGIVTQRSDVRALAGSLCALVLAGGCGGSSLPVGQTVITTTSTTVAPTTTAAPATSTTAPATSATDSGAAPAETTAVPTTTLADQSGTSPRVAFQGENGFLLGANLPWYNWGCDFGCGLGARDGAGVTSPAVRDAVATAMETASGSGMDIIRWWVFPGEPWQITAGPDGLPAGIDDRVYADFDAALALAEQFDVSLVFTIFSAPSTIPGTWLTTEDGRQRLADALGELFARYGDNPRVHTWQLVNEPEWEIWNAIVELDDFRDLTTKVSASIHANSAALSSIGSANLDGLGFWSDTGLDYYTAHWYDPMSSGGACAMCTSYSDLAARFEFEAPIVIGEYYGGPDVDLVDRLDTFYLKGYAGAWAWSLLPKRTFDEFAIDHVAAAEFAELRNADISP
jgi:hypothetical protein